MRRFDEQIVEVIQDGIIVMDHQRTIVSRNTAAEKLTGWRIGDTVPYCSYCEKRTVLPGEEKCYLITYEQSPYFSSEMPTYSGDMVDVEMSTARILHDHQEGATYYLLVLRDFTERKQREAHQLREQMMRQMIRAQEEEHHRLAQELHDGVGQSLFSIVLALTSLNAANTNPEIKGYVNEVLQEARQLMDNVRSYSKQLRPLELEQFGLASAVHVLLDSFAIHHPAVRFRQEIKLPQRVPSPIDINVYRIIQEALTNSMKYADATTLRITLMQQDHLLQLTIIDNGKGFQLGQKKQGLGLRHMEERAKSCGGQLTIHSAPGNGTTLFVTIPLERNDPYVHPTHFD